MRIKVLILLLLCVNLTFGSSISEVDALHGKIYTLLKFDLDSAQLLSDQALELSKDAGYDWGLANSYYIQGYILQVQNELAPALLKYLRASEILKYESDERSVTNYIEIQMNCGNILRALAHYDESLKFYNAALEITDYEGFEKNKLSILYNKSFVYRELKQYEESLGFLKEAESLALKLGDHTRLLNCLFTMGSVYQKIGNYDLSKLAYYKVLNDLEMNKDSKAAACINLGEIFQTEHDFDSAHIYYTQAIAIVEEIPTETDKNKRMFESLISLSKLYLIEHNYSQGVVTAEKALNYYAKVSLLPDNYQVFKVLSDLHFNNGQNANSYKYMARFYEENTKFQENQAEMMRLRDRYRIDILLASFYAGVDQEKTTSWYQMIIGFLIIGIILWIGISRIRGRILRIHLQNEIIKINKNSLV